MTTLLNNIRDVLNKYDPSQPRDNDGRWTDTGGSAQIDAPALRAKHKALVQAETYQHEALVNKLIDGKLEWDKSDQIRSLEEEYRTLNNSDDENDQERAREMEEEIFDAQLEDYQRFATEKLNSLVSDPEVSLRVRISNDKLAKMLDDGRYKNIHDLAQDRIDEEGDAADLSRLPVGGFSDVPLRENAESNLLSDDSNQTVYGYLHHPDQDYNYVQYNRETITDNLNNYGNIDLIIKPNKKKDTFITVDDSLANNVDDNMEFEPRLIPTPLLNPSWQSIPFAERDMYTMPSLNTVKNISDFETYVEAQITSGLSVNDIQSVVVHGSLPDDLENRLNDLGIDVDYE
jgi:hypothetical protein